MVTLRSTPRRRLYSSRPSASSSSTSPNKHLLLLIKILFVLVILFLLPDLVDSKSKRNKKRRKLTQKYNELKFNCTTGTSSDTETSLSSSSSSSSTSSCKDLNEAENEMCVSKCMSMECFYHVYSEQRGGELERGEVDEGREIEFENCVKDILKKEIESMSMKQRQR